MQREIIRCKGKQLSLDQIHGELVTRGRGEIVCYASHKNENVSRERERERTMFMGDLLLELLRGALQWRVEARTTKGSALLADMSLQSMRAQDLTKCNH